MYSRNNLAMVCDGVTEVAEFAGSNQLDVLNGWPLAGLPCFPPVLTLVLTLVHTGQSCSM